MENDKPTEEGQETSFSDTDWTNRILCSDGSCIGVIGPDGNCKECGRKYEGRLPEVVADAPEDDSAEPLDSAGIDAPDPSTDDAVPPQDAGADDWVSRQLCSDGNCIGVIGPDGRCKECGKPLE
jgi:hypothetical protein